MQDPIAERRQLMAALAARLTPVRGNMTDTEFGQLLADMVNVAGRGAEIDAKPGSLSPDMAPDEIRRLLDLLPGWPSRLVAQTPTTPRRLRAAALILGRRLAPQSCASSHPSRNLR